MKRGDLEIKGFGDLETLLMGAVLYIKFHICEYFLFWRIGFSLKGRRPTGEGRRVSAQRVDFRRDKFSKNEWWGFLSRGHGEDRREFPTGFSPGEYSTTFPGGPFHPAGRDLAQPPVNQRPKAGGGSNIHLYSPFVKAFSGIYAIYFGLG
jgi:hypothetical protein